MIGPLIVFILIVAFIASTSLRLVPKGEVFLKMRLGREAGTLKPGLHFIVPLIDTTLRQKTGSASKSLEFSGVKVSIDYEIRDHMLLRQSVADFDSALTMGAQTQLKKHLGGDIARMSSIDLSRIERDFSSDMADLFKPWGVAIGRITLAKKA